MTDKQIAELSPQEQQQWHAFCNALRQNPHFREQAVRNYRGALEQFGIDASKETLRTFLGRPDGDTLQSWVGWIALRSVLTILAPDFEQLPPGPESTASPATDAAGSAPSGRLGEDASPLEKMLGDLNTLLSVDQNVRAELADTTDPIADLFGPLLRKNLSLQILQQFLGSPELGWTMAEYQRWMQEHSLISMLSPTIPEQPDAPISPTGACSPPPASEAS